MRRGYEEKRIIYTILIWVIMWNCLKAWKVLRHLPQMKLSLGHGRAGCRFCFPAGNQSGYYRMDLY